MGRVYMKGALDCPFKKADQLIGEMREKGANILIVDFHAEVTSEKVALARYLDGRVEAVIGTHTHVQTNDARILPGGTAYITDAGMTGPHGGIIGMQSQEVIDSFIMGRTKRFKPAKKLPILQGVIMVFDTTGRAESITPVNLEGLA
jgi:calcineurin-like phosphoesterase